MEIIGYMAGSLIGLITVCIFLIINERQKMAIYCKTQKQKDRYLRAVEKFNAICEGKTSSEMSYICGCSQSAMCNYMAGRSLLPHKAVEKLLKMEVN